MKRIILHIPNITAAAFVQLAAVVVFASAFLLTGCSENELPSDENTDTNRTTFTIEVSDGGYAPAAGEKPGTRATENGYATQFTVGDKIGVFAVKDDEIVDGVNNLCLVATTDGSNLVWKTEDGKTPLNISDATYYAYYPWQPDEKITDKVYPATTKVTTFFYDVIKDWIPSTNQGTYIDYTSFDLMIASGTPSDKSLSFSMQHKMALVVIDLPKTKYKLTDASGVKLPDYTADGVPDTKFNGFTPYRMSDGTYRYLIKPAATNLSGSYTNATSATAEWEFKASVTAGQYGKYAIDSGTIIEKTHQLQAGDFFMKDGTLLGKDETPTPAQQAACIGIVYWVGDPTKITPANEKASISNKDNLQGDKILANDHSGCTHGLVVSLDEESCAWQANYTSVQDWLNSNRSDDFLPVQSGTGASDPLNNIQGYNNTKAIEAFNAANSGSEVYVVQEVVKYREKVPAPAASSGWYVPSEKELTLLHGKDVNNINTNDFGEPDNLNLINNKLELISATTLSSSSYYSSTEYSYDCAFYVHFGDGRVTHYYKDSSRVRFSFAF